jgi:hypothetical protein
VRAVPRAEVSALIYRANLLRVAGEGRVLQLASTATILAFRRRIDGCAGPGGSRGKLIVAVDVNIRTCEGAEDKGKTDCYMK